MKKFKLLFWLCVLSACFILTGCKKDARLENVTENTISVDKKGKITEYLIEPVDKEYYSDEELENYVKSQVDGAESVTLKHFSVDNGTAKATLQYKDAESFQAFNQQLLWFSELSGADKADVAFAGNGTVPEKGWVVVTEFETRIVGPGEPAAWSDGVTVTEDGICQTSEKRCVMIYK